MRLFRRRTAPTTTLVISTPKLLPLPDGLLYVLVRWNTETNTWEIGVATTEQAARNLDQKYMLPLPDSTVGLLDPQWHSGAVTDIRVEDIP